MKRTLSFLVAMLWLVLGMTSAEADNTVVVTSMTVAVGEAQIDIPILLTNNVPIKMIVVPLAIRSISNNAFITSLAISYSDRLPIGGALSEFVGHNQYAEEDGNCKTLVPGGFRTITFADGLPHPVATSPEAVMMTRFRIFGPDLAPGADVTGSMVLTVDVGVHEGIFEIDTTCTNPNNHLYYVLTDNSGLLPVFTKGIITVGPPPGNYPPVVYGDNYATFSFEPLLVGAPGVLGNDTDAEGDPLTAELVTDVDHGTLIFNADGSFQYTAESGFEGTVQFTYRAFDGTGYSNAAATVSIEVRSYSINHPWAADDSFSVILGFSLTIPAPGVLENDTDADGDPLTAVLAEGPYYGTLSLDANGGFRYTPTPVFTGTDHFTYVASDGFLQSAPATVRITVIPNTGGPTAHNDLYIVPLSGHLSVPAPGVLGNDTDDFGLPLMAVLDTDVQHGVLDLRVDGSFDYVAGPSVAGADMFTYHIFTGESLSSPATVLLLTDVFGNGPPPALIAIDIKPGSCPNPLQINQRGHGQQGVLPVAVLGGPDLDVTHILVETVRLKGCAPIRSALEDVSGPAALTPAHGCECSDAGPDGYLDLTLKFDKADIAAALGEVDEGDDVSLTLAGMLAGGNNFLGTDCVTIVGPRKDNLKTDNHPNPFNAATTIRYTLNEGADVRLEIFDLLGRRVATPVDEYRPAGTHEVVWNGRSQTGESLASGVYCYRIQAGAASATRKIILLK